METIYVMSINTKSKQVHRIYITLHIRQKSIIIADKRNNHQQCKSFQFTQG